jgi:hypothetical protein
MGATLRPIAAKRRTSATKITTIPETVPRENSFAQSVSFIDGGRSFDHLLDRRWTRGSTSLTGDESNPDTNTLVKVSDQAHYGASSTPTRTDFAPVNRIFNGGTAPTMQGFIATTSNSGAT